MSISRVAIAAVMALALGAATAVAQGPSGTNVALLDVGKVFEQHVSFQDKLKGLNGKFQDLEKWVRAEQQKLVKMKEAMDDLTAGSAAFKDKDAELAKKESDTRVEIGLQQKQLAEEEAKIWYDTYVEIESACATFAQKNNIGLVLQTTGGEMKPEEPMTVRMGIKRAVVYQDRLDITEEILKIVNRNAKVSTGPKPSKGAGAPVDGPRVATPSKTAPKR